MIAQREQNVEIKKDIKGMIQLEIANCGPIDIFTYQVVENEVKMYYDGKLLFNKDDMFPLHKISFMEKHILRFSHARG